MKKRLRELLEEGSLDEIAELAERRRRTWGLLISLTFDKDPLIGWRAVEAMGTITERVVDGDPALVRDHLRRLHWLLSEESGGICWRAPEAMAEIVRRKPDLLADYVSIIVSLLGEMAEEDLLHFRAGILWAIGRLGPIALKHLDTFLPDVTAALDNPDPQVRGMAVWCLAQLGQTRPLVDRPELLDDDGRAALYEDGLFDITTVGSLVRRALGESAAEE